MLKTKIKKHLIIFIIINICFSIFIPQVSSFNLKNIPSTDKGPAYKSVVPLKKLTLVQYDEESYIDDYMYLASVPTCVFNQDNLLFCNPLLFYEDEYRWENNKERTYNSRQGINYFMDDWMNFCNNYLDHMTLLNISKDEIPTNWKSKEITIVNGDSIYDISNELALSEWLYSDEIVIAVVDEKINKPNISFTSEITGEIDSSKKTIYESFLTKQADKINPRFHEFEVPEGYKFIKARTWWASIGFGTPSESDIPIGIKITIPAADPDSQFYCKYNNNEWLEVSYTQEWNMVEGMDVERTQMYAYTNGPWRLRITDVPTFDLIQRNGTIFQRFLNMLRGVTYQTDISILPGIEIPIPEKPPFGCRDIDFELSWDNSNLDLGMSIIGSAGEEIISSTIENVNTQKIHLDQFGECPDDKQYSIAVFKLNDYDATTDFRIKYSWKQNFSEKEKNSITSATEGSILASHLNSPMLYIPSTKIKQSTINTLYKLGVKKIHLVDFGKNLKNHIKNDIEQIVTNLKIYNDLEEFYIELMELTNQNDIIISTIDPWTKWLVAETKPYQETKNALFIGPAAYCAAYHGSPVFIIDNHPELSSAVNWHTEFWKRHGDGRPDPPGAPMSLTGRQVYNYFNSIGYDKEGLESMITIAGQYDIGAPWDRTFVGRSNNGRFYGSPVDVSYWIPRNLFYPSLIFKNPSLENQINTFIQGSISERRAIFPFGPLGLKVIKPSQEEQFYNPAILHSYICYNHKLNDAFDKYYGFQYECRDDIIPGVSASPYKIDEGVDDSKIGAVWPDFTSTEANPYYFAEGGFDNIYSTGYSAIINNLNNGVLLWNFGSHGSAKNSGFIITWPEEGIQEYVPINLPFNLFGYEKESNPWRGYDFLMGSTEKPDSMTMNVHGILAGFIGNPEMPGLFPLGIDYTINEKPIRQGIFKLLSYVPFTRRIVINNPWLADSSYFKDGVVGASIASKINVRDLNGTNLDDDLENLYSCGWILSACFPAYKYIHLTMLRHGPAFQIMDPWPTSWYSYWTTTIPRDLVIGDSIGEAYTKGISHVGKLYATDPPEWWWDAEQNLVYFGDPDLRFYVPSTKYSDDNYWKIQDTQPLLYDANLDINGHNPFGATYYPNKIEPFLFDEQYLIIIFVILIIIGILIIYNFKRKKK